MARAPVREVSPPSRIQAISAPTNSFVRPADPTPSGLHQVAEGLAAFDSGLSSFLKVRKDESDKEDKQRAIRDAYLENAPGYDEGTKRGLIPPQESPTYMTWYKTTRGDVQGRKLRDQFAVRYQTWEGRNSGDPKAYDKFVQDFLRENVGETEDPEVLAGLNPHIEALLNEGYSVFGNDRAAAIKGGALATSGAILTDNIERAEAEGRATGEIDYEGLWGNMLEVREEALKRNLAADYDPYFVDAILLQAEEAGSEELLGLLEKTLPGQQHPMSYDLKVREKRDATIARIQSRQASKATTEAAAEEKADKARHNDLVADTLKKINDDPNHQVSEETIKELSRRDPDFRTKLPEYRKKLMSDGTPEDPDALLEVYSQIDAGRGRDFVNDMRAKGVIKDPETYTRMLDRVEKIQNANKPGGTFDSPTYKDVVRRITNATGEGNLDVMDMVRGITDDGLRALFDYRTQLIQWEIDNPGLANHMMAREKAAMEIGKVILDRIQPVDMGEQRGIYPEAKPAGQTATQPAQEAPQEAAEPEATAPVPDNQKPLAESSPARQAAIAKLALKHGISPEDANRFLMESEAEEEKDRGLLGNLPNPLRAFLPPPIIEDAMNLWNTLTGGDEEEPQVVDPTTTNSIRREDRDALNTLLDNPAAASTRTAELSTSFVDPKSNPEVRQEIRQKFQNRRMPASLRLNNMGAISITGNVSRSWAAKQPGFVGVVKRPAAEGGYYAKYATPEHGVAAASRLLEKYGRNGVSTASSIVRKWSVDRAAHNAYAKTLVLYLNAAGFDVTPTTQLDLSDAEVRIAILKAKSAHESGLHKPVYADNVFRRGASYLI